MAKFRHRKLTLASTIAAGLALAACSSGSSSSTGGTSAPPTVGSTPVTIHLYSRSTANDFFGPDGKPITNQNAQPQVGDYVVSTASDYTGNHTSHSGTQVGTDHLICVIASASATGGTAQCYGQIDLGGSMLVADHQTIQLTSQNAPISLSFTGGTGRYSGVHGTVQASNVDNSNDSDFVITASKSGGSSSTGATSAPPTVGTTPVTIHLYSDSTSNDTFGPDGKPITNPNAQPQVGDYFVTTATDYTGNHTSHSGTRAGTDHLVCVVASTSATGGTAQCYGQIALGISMLVADHQTIQLTSQNAPINVSFTGGTGQYNGVHGTIQASNVGNSNNSDLVITVSK